MYVPEIDLGLLNLLPNNRKYKRSGNRWYCNGPTLLAKVHLSRSRWMVDTCGYYPRNK